MIQSLPPDFRDRPLYQRFFVDLLVLCGRKKIKLVCCESFRKVDKLRACKGCPMLYTEHAPSRWRRFVTRRAKKIS